MYCLKKKICIESLHFLMVATKHFYGHVYRAIWEMLGLMISYNNEWDNLIEQEYKDNYLMEG